MKHEVLIVEVGEIRPHPNADSLGITTIRGFDVIVRLGAWNHGDRGVYVEPDYVVPSAPWSEMLKGHNRIRVKRLRGVVSQGLLLSLAEVGLPADLPVGEDVMERLGIVRYQPSEATVNGDNTHGPAVAEGVPAYDLESWRQYRGIFAPDDTVVVTEKLHGESARFVFAEGRMHIGSRVAWKNPEATTPWSVALRCNPWIEGWCRAHEGLVLYGEVFGNVPKMAYGVAISGGLKARGFRAFDVLDHGRWLPWPEFAAIVPPEHRVPVLYEGPHAGVDASMAEGKSTLANHVREGFVVKPTSERTSDRIGRVALKMVGNGYYESGAD